MSSSKAIKLVLPLEQCRFLDKKEFKDTIFIWAIFLNRPTWEPELRLRDYSYNWNNLEDIEVIPAPIVKVEYDFGISKIHKSQTGSIDI
jgi:hypothetical protein